MLWINTQIVMSYLCSRINMSLPICSTVQLYISRECKYNTNPLYWHWQSKTESNKGWNYYLSNLKSECNNGMKLLRFKVYFSNCISTNFERPTFAYMNILLNMRNKILCHRNEKKINQKFVWLKVATINISRSTETGCVPFFTVPF